MGLDMYLEARKNVSAYDWEREPSQQALTSILGALEFSAAELDRPSVTVSLPVGYWRKANQIHNWFVQNVQDGNDDCRDYYVSRENLVALKETCEKVLDDMSLAQELLPSTSGFFFGSTEYDEYYEEELRETVRIVDKALQDIRLEKDTYFSYQASW
jgi:hypothetical protein